MALSKEILTKGCLAYSENDQPNSALVRWCVQSNSFAFADALLKYVKQGNVDKRFKHLSVRCYASRASRMELTHFTTVYFKWNKPLTRRRAKSVFEGAVNFDNSICDPNTTVYYYRPSQEENWCKDVPHQEQFGTVWWEAKRSRGGRLHFVDHCERYHTCGITTRSNRPSCEDEDLEWDDWPFLTTDFEKMV